MNDIKTETERMTTMTKSTKYDDNRPSKPTAPAPSFNYNAWVRSFNSNNLRRALAASTEVRKGR